MAKSIQTDASLTGKNVIARLRESTNPINTKHTLLIRALSDNHLTEIYHRLMRGQDPSHIAKVIQEKWKLLVTVEYKVVCDDIKKFKDRVIGDLVPQKTDTAITSSTKKDLYTRASSISKKVDGMELMAWTIGEQAKRLEMWREKEDTARVPFKSTEVTVRELGSLLEKYVRLQMDLGVLDSKPSEYNLKIKYTFDGLMQHVVKNENTIIDTANQFAKLIESSSQILEQDADGVYKVADDHKDDSECK